MKSQSILIIDDDEGIRKEKSPWTRNPRIFGGSLERVLEDIPLLLTHYVEEGSPRWGKEVAGFTPQALNALFRYSWPGNIRELRHLVEASLMRCRSAWISLEELPHSFHRQFQRDQGPPPTERDLLLWALLIHQGNRSRAARHLGWSRAKLYRKMDQYGLDRIPGQDQD